MIRAFKESDCFMTLSDMGKRELIVALPRKVSTGRIIRELWKRADVAFTCSGLQDKALCSWGFMKNGHIWVVFSDSAVREGLPVSFYKAFSETIQTAVCRYGRVSVLSLVETEEEIRFHEKLIRIVKATPCHELTLNGHRFVMYEKRWNV